jgi:hypothetical protein
MPSSKKGKKSAKKNKKAAKMAPQVLLRDRMSVEVANDYATQFQVGYPTFIYYEDYLNSLSENDQYTVLSHYIE